MKNKKHSSVQCIPLPTPYPVGRINTYLIEGEEPLLIDTGVKSKRSLDTLESALASLGKKIDELAAILVTHRHYDHSGAAPELARRSDAPVICHQASLLDIGAGRKTFLELIQRYGAPAVMTDALELDWQRGDVFGESLESITNLRFVEPEQVLSLAGVELVPILSPGHCPGHLCFRLPHHSSLICGDLLLSKITSNPLPHFDNDAPRGRQPSLQLYLDSLKKVAALGPLAGLPGHGEALPDTSLAAEMARQHILTRSEKVLRLMHRFEGQQIFEIASEFFGEDKILGQTLAFCEILAHADFLEDQGKITVDPEDGVIHTVKCDPHGKSRG